MTDAGRTLTLGWVQAIAFQAKTDLKRAGSTNFLVELRGTSDDGQAFVGLGEGQPRDALTGDRGGTSWDFLTACLERLHDREVAVSDASAALSTVRTIMDEFGTIAEDYNLEADRLVPFRGTLMGLEMALLDLLARSLEMPVATMLGSQRTKATAHASPVSSRLSPHARREQLHDQAVRFPTTLLYGTDDVEQSLELLESAAEVNRSDDVGEPSKPLWIDLNGRLTRKDARAFVKRVAAAIDAGRLPAEIVIQQPVAAADYGVMPALQRLADRASASRDESRTDLRIMADSRLWNVVTLGRRAQAELRASRFNPLARSPRAVLIRPAQAGGLLASIELAEQIRATSPATTIVLGGMLGGTDVTAQALRNLAMAMPELDSVADLSVSAEPILTAPAEPGLWANVPYEDVLGTANEFFSIPEPTAPTYGGLQANTYDDVDVIRPLGLNFTKGHLLEREALALGLSTKRFTRSAFVATDGVHEPLGFKRSRTPLSSALSMALCTHKEATRLRLQQAGVPVPMGRTFVQGDYESARAFVARIGYPVVVKPAMGVSGVGVAANVRDDDALQQAFDRLAATRFGSGDFIVEQHINGRDHRIVVVGDEVVGAIVRDPASVDGDGVRSVAELIIAKNVARRANSHLWGRPIKYDDAVRFELERADLSLYDVPEIGQRVVLSNSGNLALGADSVDVLDTLHPSIKDACIRAVQAVPGMTYCGVDFLLEDHTKPLDEQEAAVCELNAHAAIGNCEYPIYGTPRDVARKLIEQCVTQFDLAVHPRRADRLALRLTIRGRVKGVGYRAWLDRKATEYGLSGWVRNVDERTAEAVVVGDLVPASALVAAAVHGPRAAVPTEVITTHIDPPDDLAGFKIVKNAPREPSRAG